MTTGDILKIFLKENKLLPMSGVVVWWYRSTNCRFGNLCLTFCRFGNLHVRHFVALATYMFDILSIDDLATYMFDKLPIWQLTYMFDILSIHQYAIRKYVFRKL
jgi:hypothetical protein